MKIIINYIICTKVRHQEKHLEGNEKLHLIMSILFLHVYISNQSTEEDREQIKKK